LNRSPRATLPGRPRSVPRHRKRRAAAPTRRVSATPATAASAESNESGADPEDPLVQGSLPSMSARPTIVSIALWRPTFHVTAADRPLSETGRWRARPPVALEAVDRAIGSLASRYALDEGPSGKGAAVNGQLLQGTTTNRRRYDACRTARRRIAKQRAQTSMMFADSRCVSRLVGRSTVPRVEKQSASS